MAGSNGDEANAVASKELTQTQAEGILEAVDTYFQPESFVRGVHRTEIVAEAMLREGLVELADSVMAVHHNLLKILGGKFKEASFLSEIPGISDVIDGAKGTKFEEGAKALMEDVQVIEHIFKPEEEHSCAPNWDASVPLLQRTQQAKYPDGPRRARQLAARDGSLGGRGV